MKHPDVQALVYSSFAQLRHARYWLLRVVDSAAVRAWLRRPGVLALVHGGNALGGDRPFQQALAIAFTHAGLRAMGLAADDADSDNPFPFPSAFRGGMTEPERARALGDTDVDHWRWTDRERGDRGAVHVLLAHFRAAAFDPASVGGDVDADTLAHSGFDRVELVNTCPSFIQSHHGATQMYEPFGFRDGLSQPVLRAAAAGTKAEQRRRLQVGDEMADDAVVADGEFILGLPNEYGDPAYAPDLSRWRTARPPGAPGHRFGSHGSYLAVRHIWQDVAGFETFDRAHPAPGDGSPSLVEKMVGRRRNGMPLVTSPHAAPDFDAFRYRVADAEGFQCPLGAHVRRGNPRDTLGWDVESGLASSKLHRLIRRARVFTDRDECALAADGRCGHDDSGRGCGRGLFFIALNSDLDRQFEFVQQRWVGNPRFAGLTNENDPIMGGPGRRAFTVQGLASGQQIHDIPAFTRVVGGGYFFLPGLAALRFLGGQ
jgi:putative iron-dependent peroxidase